MKKIFNGVMIVVFLVVTGCMTSLLEVQNENSEPPLINEIFCNKVADGFRVFQILDDGSILVGHPGFILYQVNSSTGIRADVGSESFLDMHVVPIVNDYVDNQNLKTGKYRYTGIYEYTTTEKKVRRVRNFVEIQDRP